MLKNTFYSAPEAELLDVRFEDNILSGEIDNDENLETFIQDGEEPL